MLLQARPFQGSAIQHAVANETLKRGARFLNTSYCAATNYDWQKTIRDMGTFYIFF
jgi:hypothetical protein